jgi:hypothetical protein
MLESGTKHQSLQQEMTMTIKDILRDFNARDTKLPAADETQQIRQQRETLLVRLNRCFVEIILPSVFEVEKDINHIGYWNQLNIGQSTSLESGKPNIKAVTLHFFPEKSEQLPVRHREIDNTYKVNFAASRDLRNIHFAFQIPKRIPPTIESENTPHTVGTIDTAMVDAFLEHFVKSALAAYNSDRMLR